MQILHGTGRSARHSAVLLKLALAAKAQFGSVGGEGNGAEKRLSRLRRQYFK